MKCDIGLLQAFLDGQLSTADRSEVTDHLATCESCKAEIENLRQYAHVADLQLAALDPLPTERMSPAQALAVCRSEVQPPKPTLWQTMTRRFDPMTGFLSIRRGPIRLAAIGLVGSSMADYALAIGMDTAQGRPGDALEYAAAAGGAAYLLGPTDDSLAIIESSYSYVSDTPDFWRRAYQKYPEHGQRFTGEPAYFKHITSAAETYLQATQTTAQDYTYAVFHQPNTKFPTRVARSLGFTQEQIAPGLLLPMIGNTYSGAAIIGLTAILDVAQPGDRILMVSFGSGAGSDAIGLRVTDQISIRRNLAPATQQYIARRTEIDYATYARMRGKIVLK